MIESAMQTDAVDSVEAVLRAELGSADTVAATVAPILHHLLDTGGSSLFADAVVASVRGMAADLQRQLIEASHGGPGEPAEAASRGETGEALRAEICGNAALIRHLHALALEWHLTQHLQVRLSLDPVLTPLLQAEIASSNAANAAVAMQLLAAQARFCQDQRRMKLPLAELPGDLLHTALLAIRVVAGADGEADAAGSLARKSHDEARTRLGLCRQLIAAMAGNAQAALGVTHAGVALFLSALAIGSGQHRDAATLAVNESQLARLALSLRAAGLKQPAVEEAFLAIHPDVALPEGFDRLSPDRAAALLAAAAPFPGG